MTAKRVAASAIAGTTVLIVLSLQPGVAAAYSFGSSPQVFTPPSTIASDCSVDVTKPLYDWINTLPQGTSTSPTEVEFAAGACYQVDGMLYLRGLTDFIFDGNGAFFEQSAVVNGEPNGDPPPDRPAYCGSDRFQKSEGTVPDGFDIMWFVEGGCDLMFENMIIDGTNTAGNPGGSLEQDSAIQFSGVQRALVTGLTIDSVWGDFVTVTGLHEAPDGGGNFPSTDITVSDNDFLSSGRQGVTVVYGNGVTVTGNTISNVPATAVDLESEVVGGAEENILVSGNIFREYAFLLSAVTGAELSAVAFVDNSVGTMKILLAPMPQSQGNNVTISGNTAVQPTDWSRSSDIDIGNVDDVLVSENVLPIQPPTKVFVHAGKTSADVAVQDNTLNPGPGAGSSFLPTPLTAEGPAQGTDCGNTTANGANLDSNANPPSLDQCESISPTQPTVAVLPEFISST